MSCPRYSKILKPQISNLKAPINMKYLICISAMLLTLSSCKSTSKNIQEDEQSPVSIQFVADSAFAYCQAQCDFGPRTMNSEAHEQCAAWIQQKFQQFGCDVELQKADVRGYDGTILHATNIIARTKADVGPAKRDAILICAHWDSRPWKRLSPRMELLWELFCREILLMAVSFSR